MPTTKKQEIYFGMMMCLGMVFIMTTYNFMLSGMLDVLTPLQMLKEMIIIFIIALALELIIVGPIAHKVVFSLPFKKEKKLYMILTLSTCMVIGMVFFMSIYGLIHASIAGSLTNQHVLTSFFTIFAKNIMIAYPAQILIVGPAVRFLFSRFLSIKQASSL